MTKLDIFEFLVPSYFDIEGYEIIILQNPEGDLLTLKIMQYE
tara:strand:- start:1058 stop:1183 length:126 start_codon:yes stop_codon:yes gene_type:complete